MDDVTLNANVTVTGGDADVDGDGNVRVDAVSDIVQASTSIVSADGGGSVDYTAGSLGQTSGHPNLVASYDFNGDIADSSGNGRDATAVGGELALDRFGQADSAYRFDGIDDYLMASNVGLPEGNASRTMTAWMKLDSYGSSPGHSPVLFAYGSNAAGQQSGVRLANEHWQFSFWEPAFDLNVATNPPLGEWVHVAMVYDQTTSTARIYQNGVDVGSRTVVPNTMLSANGLTIGRNTEIQGAQFYYLPGTLDDVQIFDAALTPAEIATLSTALPVGTGGTITMADGAQALSQTGTISLFTDGDITLGRLSTGNGTSSAVTVTTTAGDVIDGGDSDGEDIDANSAGAIVTLTAASGIGDAPQAGGAADQAIETAIAVLNASVSGSGGIDIDETDAIELTDVDTANGFIRVDAGGAIAAVDVDSTTDAEANDVILTTSAGNINVTNISVGTMGSAGDVVLNAAGAITQAVVSDAVNILADGVRLETAGGDVGAEATVAYAGVSDDDNLLNLTANELEADVIGGLFVHNSRNLQLIDQDLTVSIDGTDNDSNADATATTSTGTTRILATGTITVTELLNATGQLASLEASGAGNGIRSDGDTNGAGDNDILADQVALRSDDGIGTMADHLEINATSGTENLVSGETVRVAALSPLTVTHDVTAQGMVTLIAADSVGLLPVDNLTVNSDVTVESVNSDIILSGGDDVNLQDRSTIQALNGSIDIFVDYDHAPDDFIEDADAGTGAVARLFGTINSPNPTDVLGDMDNDRIILL
ncbi:MAG: LamG domain-containing protein, partial [Planctomycetota bacterium]